MSDLATQDVKRAWTDTILLALLAVALWLSIMQTAYAAAFTISVAVIWKVLRL